MELIATLYQHGLWIFGPGLCLSLALLVLSIRGVLRTISASRLHCLPVVERQEVELTAAGRIVLCMEGPIFSRRFAHLRFSLTGPDGVEVDSRRTLLRSRTSGLFRATIELEVCTIATPGRHVLTIEGLASRTPEDDDLHIVLTRPHLGRSLLFVLAIVFTAIAAIANLVFLLMRLLSVGIDP